MSVCITRGESSTCLPDQTLYVPLSIRETGSPVRLKNALVEHIFCSPSELLKLSVPSIVYAVQNNMAFLALSNLDAAVYQVQTTGPCLLSELVAVILC